MRLSPREPLKAIGTKYLGDSELGLGHFDAAIDDYHKAIDLGMPSMWPYASLTAAYALAGKIDEAKSALAEARRLEPKLTIKFVTLFGPPIPNLFEGLRKAGLAEEAPAEPAHLSIVVLPFTNLSNDLNQDYFADGVTDNLTTELSRIRDSFVIARSTAFTYKDKNVDAREIGKELGVRYVLEGSVQRDQNRVRVNAQLVDAETGAHLWPTGSRKMWPTSLSCRIRWWRGWATLWASSWSRRKPKKAPAQRTRTRSIWPCAAGPRCGNPTRSRQRRSATATMPRFPCSTRR
jgi:TolB-like protein